MLQDREHPRAGTGQACCSYRLPMRKRKDCYIRDYAVPRQYLLPGRRRADRQGTISFPRRPARQPARQSARHPLGRHRGLAGLTGLAGWCRAWKKSSRTTRRRSARPGRPLCSRSQRPQGGKVPPWSPARHRTSRRRGAGHRRPDELSGQSFGTDAARWQAWWDKLQDQGNDQWLEERRTWASRATTRLDGDLERRNCRCCRRSRSTRGCRSNEHDLSGSGALDQEDAWTARPAT